MAKDITALQNGSDVRGVAAEGVAGENVNLTAEAANRIAQAFVIWLSKKTGKAADALVVGAGRDARITGSALAHAAIEGLRSQGAAAADCGLATTPAMFMTTVFDETKYDGAVMITASHLPFNRNGMKFFDGNGGLEHEDITQILNIASTIEESKGGSAFASGAKKNCRMGCVSKFDLMPLYAAHLRGKIAQGLGAKDGEECLKGLHIVVDAGNGDAGFFAEDVLKPLGADTSGSQFLEPDGMFPNHIPNPENKDAMKAICDAVRTSRAGLGLIFDTDVDRMSCVLPDSTLAGGARPIARDAIIALAAAIVAPSCPGGTIVTDSVTSDRLTQFIENTLLMKHLRYMRGYKNVIDKCKELNETGIPSPLAMETSGHGALKENYYLDDGAYLAVKIIVQLAIMQKQGKTLASLISGLPPAGDEGEWRFKIKPADFKAYGNNVLQEFEKRAVNRGYDLPASYEGVRISFHGEKDKAQGARGWMLLRMSLHDPVMPLNAEGAAAGDKEKIAACAKELLQGFDALDMGMF